MILADTQEIASPKESGKLGSWESILCALLSSSSPMKILHNLDVNAASLSEGTYKTDSLLSSPQSSSPSSLSCHHCCCCCCCCCSNFNFGPCFHAVVEYLSTFLSVFWYLRLWSFSTQNIHLWLFFPLPSWVFILVFYSYCVLSPFAPYVQGLYIKRV